MDNYTLVYDYFKTPNDFGNEGFLIMLAGIIALIYIVTKYKDRKGRKPLIIFLSLYCIASLIWNITIQVVHYNSFNEIKEIYKAGDSKTVEGKVANYSPMDIEGHGSMESFSVNGVTFSYSDYFAIDGYNNSCVKGGVICENGQEVKIQYVSTVPYINAIIKIELKKE